MAIKGLIAAALALALVACGGGGGSTTAAPTPAGAVASPAADLKVRSGPGAFAGIGDGQGRLLVVGISGFRMALQRFLSDGSPDPSFNAGTTTPGLLVGAHALPGDGGDAGRGLALDAQGRILVVGRSWSGSATSLTVWRYLADGSLDRSFNATAAIPGTLSVAAARGVAIAVDSAGRIVVVGALGSDARTLGLWRFLEDGSADSSFNGSGAVTAPAAAAYALGIDAAGRIVVAGEILGAQAQTVAVWRFLANGAADSSFGVQGQVTGVQAVAGNSVDMGLALTFDGEGRVLLAGLSEGTSAAPSLVLWRLEDSGVLDTGFGHGGVVVRSGGMGYAVQVNAAGKILVAGHAGDGAKGRLALWRFNADGSADTGLGEQGLLTSAAAIDGNDFDCAYGFANAVDGSLLLAGLSSGDAVADATLVWRLRL